MENELKTLSDAIRYFADEQICIDTVAAMRWPNGPQCPACLMPNTRQHWLKNQRRWQCRDCGKQYSVKVNTIFEDSPIKLDKWMTAMWLLANCKNGISSYEIARDISVTQKTRMVHAATDSPCDEEQVSYQARIARWTHRDGRDFHRRQAEEHAQV